MTPQERDGQELALALIGAVRSLSPAAVAQVLAVTPDRLAACAVTLAAMVDDDRTVDDLLGWLPGEAEVVRLVAEEGTGGCAPYLWGGSVGSSAQHGTRSRYNAGCRGAACVAAQRVYDARPERQAARRARGQRPAG